MVFRRWSAFELLFVFFLPIFVPMTSLEPPEPFAPDVTRKRGVYIEKWEGIDSYSIENLEKSERYPNLPTWRGYGTQFTQPQNWGENFGTRIRAYFVPKVSGAHVFFIASDNSGELFLSNDEFSSHKSLIAKVREERFTNPNQYNKYIEQRSWPVQLHKDHYYYIETLMKEFYDKDHMSVAVRTPKKFVKPITADYLWTALPEGYTRNNESTTKSRPNINIIKIAAKAGAKAGASFGLMAAKQSAAMAGAEAGKLAGEEAGAKAGEAAAAAAAQSVFAKTFKTVLSAYKFGNLKFMVRLFGPRGEKIIRKFRNTTGTDNNTTDLLNNAPNHVINIHLYGKDRQKVLENSNTPQGSSSTLPNRYLPNPDTGTKSNNVYGNANNPGNQVQSQNPQGEFPNEEHPTNGVFGSSGQLMHKEQYVPIDRGSNPRQGANGQKKSVGPLEIPQNDESENPPQFTAIPKEPSSFSSLKPDSRSSTPSSETSDSFSPHFETLEQNDFTTSPKPKFNILQNDDDETGSSPVFTTIVSEGTKNNSIHNPASNAGTQSTRENERFVYYTKPGEDPNNMARKLVYEGGPASKIVFDAQYSIHSLDVPAIQLNLTKNLCLNSFHGKITLKGQCQYFIIREGLLPKTGTDDISLESSCVPGHYLVQRNYRFYVDERDGTLHFAREATFALYKTMAFPFSLQIMSFSHYMWFMCESKNKDPHKTEMELGYVSSKESAIYRCSFTFLPLPYAWDPKKNCKGVLSFENPKIPGQQNMTGHHPGAMTPETTITGKVLNKNEIDSLKYICRCDYGFLETCVALNFINKAGIPFRLLSDIKQDHYMVMGKSFKLKTVIKRPDLHHHITYRAEDPTGKNTILFFGDNSITLLPQHHCEEFVPVEVTCKPGLSPSVGESTSPIDKNPGKNQPSKNYQYHYHLPPAPPPRPSPSPQTPSLAGCRPSCSYPLSCANYCPSHCCKRELETVERSVVPRTPNGCVCGSDCSPKEPNKTIMCNRMCQEICKEKQAIKNG